MSNTEWTKQTWNPTVGCTPVSEALTTPLLRKKPTTYFVDSMSDLFCEDVPDEFIAECFAVMHLACWHTYQIRTNRPKRMAELLLSERFATLFDGAIENWSGMADDLAGLFGYFDPLHRLTTDWRAIDHAAMPAAHVWLGTSIADQAAADERRDAMKTIADQGWFTWVSYEPAIGPVNWRDRWDFIRWMVCGGESGKGARPFDVQWARDAIEYCGLICVPVFVKQLGANPYVDPCPQCGHPESSHTLGRTSGCQHGDGSEENPICGCRKMLGELDHKMGDPMAHHPPKDPKGGDMSEWPKDLRVREFPVPQVKAVSP